jgi:hypothetical protein
MIEGLRMDGLASPDDRGYSAFDVELVRLLNRNGIHSIEQITRKLDISEEDAELLLAPGYLLIGEGLSNIHYYRLAHSLGLDIAWLVGKIIRVHLVDSRRVERLQSLKEKKHVKARKKLKVIHNAAYFNS